MHDLICFFFFKDKTLHREIEEKKKCDTYDEKFIFKNTISRNKNSFRFLFSYNLTIYGKHINNNIVLT